ncbi:MAG: hypothetical protein KJ583_01915 [Nanoarchaeota archaeon]|nr:hypothetical protein [Nanoarchaeota archaeon]MBU1269958.1 hypothetical protein [Nanoarchaeota archaeon]MBU1604049.1 hypothetical protein [Nanoarchaeota archaeon]MBU2442540.1 hypothetical protein [Nanoarchaeota archaeon]
MTSDEPVLMRCRVRRLSDMSDEELDEFLIGNWNKISSSDKQILRLMKINGDRKEKQTQINKYQQTKEVK